MKFFKKIFIVFTIVLLSNFVSAKAGYDVVVSSNINHQLVQRVVDAIVDEKPVDEILKLIKTSERELSKIWFSLQIPMNHKFTFLSYAIYKNNVNLSKKIFHSELLETFKISHIIPTKKLAVEASKTEETELERISKMLLHDPKNKELLGQYMRLYMAPKTGLTFCKTCGKLCPGGRCDTCDYSSGEDWDD